MDLPKYLKARPTYGGYVVPYFVAWYLGDELVDERTPGAKPDFRVVDIRRAAVCRQRNVCWLCGKQLGSFKWFVFGPSSALGRLSVEPPSHKECAHYAVVTCPFMLTPGRGPRETSRPVEIVPDMQPTNPGLVVLWSTKTYKLIPRDPPRGIYYYEPGEPHVVEFWREGRKATREEIEQSINHALSYNKLDRNDREVAWRVEHLLRYAPPEEKAA